MAHPSILAPRRDEIRVPQRPGPAAGPAPAALPLVSLALSLPVAPPVVLMPRRVPGGVLATLDALPAAALPRLDYVGPAGGLRRAMRAALAERLRRPRWLANWLLDDVLDHAATLTALSGAATLRAWLGVPGVPGGAAPGGTPLAAAAARCRLVTAYRGPGFDWLPPRSAAGLEAGLATVGALPEERSAGLLRRLPRGDVAILRGDGDGPGVAHRAVHDGGEAALLLLIEEADGPRRAAPAVAGRPAGAPQ